MKIFDPSQYPELRQLFPELTAVQFETSFLLALGLSQKEIAVIRAVSYKNVKQVINDSRAKFEPQSLTGMITVFHVRLVLFALYRRKVPYHKWQ